MTTKARSMTSTGDYRKYGDLLKGRFELTKVVRIERANVSVKTVSTTPWCSTRFQER